MVLEHLSLTVHGDCKLSSDVITLTEPHWLRLQFFVCDLAAVAIFCFCA